MSTFLLSLDFDFFLSAAVVQSNCYGEGHKKILELSTVYFCHFPPQIQMVKDINTKCSRYKYNQLKINIIIRNPYKYIRLSVGYIPPPPPNCPTPLPIFWKILNKSVKQMSIQKVQISQQRDIETVNTGAPDFC